MVMSSYAQDVAFTLQNPINTNDGVNDFYEVDVYASSQEGFKLGEMQIRFLYNTEAFGEALADNEIVEIVTPEGSLFGEALFDGQVPMWNLIRVANTLTSFTTVHEALVSAGTFTENTITPEGVHLFTVKLKYIDASKSADLVFSSDPIDQDDIFTACGPFVTPDSGFANSDCIDFPGTQLPADEISFDSSEQVLSTANYSKASNVAIYTSGLKQVTVSGTSSASKISVYSITGQLIFKGNLAPNISNKVDLSLATSGVYVVKIASETTDINKKIILR